MALEWTRCVGFDSSNKLCPPRNFHSSTLVGDYLYIIGGTNSEKFFSDVKKIQLRDLESGNPMSARWDVASLRTGESIPTSGGGAFAARSRHTAVAIGSDIYVFGGVKGGNDLFCLDTANDPLTWKVVKTTGRPPSSRLGHSATAFEDRMFLFGGTDGINDYNDLYEFSPKTGHWSELANIAGTAPKPSPNYSLHVLRNNLIVLGGSASDTCMSVFMVNLVGEKRWWELPSFRAPFDPPPCRYLYASTCLSSVNVSALSKHSGGSKQGGGGNQGSNNGTSALPPSAITGTGQPYKILVFGGTIRNKEKKADDSGASAGLCNETFVLEFHADKASATLGATAEYRIKWVKIPSVGKATTKDAVAEDSRMAEVDNIYWKRTPCPRIGHTMVSFPNLTRKICQAGGGVNSLNVPVQRVYVFGGSDRKRQFGDLHYADLDVSFTWQINTGATISRSSTVVSPTEDVLPLQFPDVWPSARHGCTLTPVLSKQLQSQSSAHKAISMFLLLGGSSLKSAKHVKSNAESSALSKKAYSDGAYVLCRGKVSDETSVGAETGAIPSRHDDLQWRAIKMSNSKSLHHSPLLKSGFHGHTVTPIYDEKSAFGPSNSHTSSFLVFGGLVNGTPGASALWHLSVDAAQLAQMLSSPSIGSDQGKWCTWKPVTLQSKSNKLGTTRMGHAAICFGRTLYIVGGYSDGAYQENSLALNTGSEKMRWRQLQNSAFARVGHSIVAYNESREEALMFGGTWKGEATNSLFTVYFAKEVVEKGNVVPKKGQHTRGETKLFVTQGGTPPSPRFGHSAVRLEPYEKSRSFLSARGAQGVKKGTITVGFDSDVDDDVTDAKHESHEQNYFGRSLKMMIVGGIVPSKVAKRKVSVCDQKDMYHEVMDIHILDLETLCWSTPLLLPSVDDSWRQVNYEYFCEILYNRAELDAKGKVSSNKSMKLAAKKKNDEGEDKAFGPSKDDMMRALNDASSNSELAKVALKAYKPLKRLYKSKQIREKVVEQSRRGQLDSFKRSVKVLALDNAAEANNGLPSFLPTERSRFGACNFSHDSIVLFGGNFYNTLEARAVWTFQPWWKEQDYTRLRGRRRAFAGGAGSSTSDQESSFYSTDSDAYASGADGGFYSSGEES